MINPYFDLWEVAMATKEFRIEIPQDALDDLHDRIGRTRWPDELPGVGWERGVPLNYLQSLAEYWRDGFDWRAQEAVMNQYPQFIAEVDDVSIHFIHVRSPRANATPPC